MLLNQIAFVLMLLLKAFSVWFLVTALLFWKRPTPYERHDPHTRFACLIPARSEEAVIAALVQSLKEQNYPNDRYDVYVLPNNCTDDTEAAALSAGAKLLRCAGPVRCKGDVLHQAIIRLLPLDYDVFCVFDADNIVDTAFLARMNDAFCAGARVAKARMLAKNPYDSWVASCYALYYGLNETFFNRSRAAFGLSAKLVGTGFAVHRDVLVRMGGWNTETIAEDAEFSAMCAALGERVQWVPEAVTYDEAPRSFRVSLMQRRRWCSGIMSAAERNVPRLFCALRVTNVPRAVDMIFFLCAPFVQAFSPVPAVLPVISAILCGTLFPLLMATIPTLLGSWIGMTLLAVWLTNRIGLNVRQNIKGILLFPLFMASWLPLQIISAVYRTRIWKEIHHGGAPQPSLSQSPRLPT